MTSRLPQWRRILNSSSLTPEVQAWRWRGSGTDDDPFAVGWIENDVQNPMLFSVLTRWTFMMIVAMTSLMVSLDSSAYSGTAESIMHEFGCSEEFFTLGISLFVLGFAIGPLIWAPLSEVFGRRIIFIPTYFGLTAFNAGAAGSRTIAALLIQRFLAGAIGSNALIGAGAIVTDLFPARQRGLALAYYSVTPFLGPTLGPIFGGFVGSAIGWRWVEGLLAVLTGALLVLYTLAVPETYAPVILRRRAARLSALTGKVHKSDLEIKQGPKTLTKVLRTSLTRPWVLLFTEPIVLILSCYQAVIYATLYMCFAAFPIVYQDLRGWSPGVGGSAFLGVTVGMVCTIPFNIIINSHYAKLSDDCSGFAPPEARLPSCMIGAVAAPIGLFWLMASLFAWTNGPAMHWIISIAAGIPFGFGLVVIFQGVNNYLVDSYTIFAASVMAGSAVLRSLLAAAFPLFTSAMFRRLGIHWASTVPAFLALVFIPFPFLLYKYGPSVRAKCTYAAEAMVLTKQLQSQAERRLESPAIEKD